MRVYKVFRHFGEYSTKDEKHLAFLSPMAHNNGWKRCLFSVSLAFGTTNSDRSYSARDVWYHHLFYRAASTLLLWLVLIGWSLPSDPQMSLSRSSGSELRYESSEVRATTGIFPEHRFESCSLHVGHIFKVAASLTKVAVGFTIGWIESSSFLCPEWILLCSQLNMNTTTTCTNHPLTQRLNIRNLLFPT